MQESIIQVQKAVNDLLIDEIQDRVRTCLDQGIAPLEIIEQGISKGLEMVGEQFEKGTYFLADLILAGEVVNEAMPMLESEMDPAATGKKEKVILATVQGDIHEIGKNIVGMLLKANGYHVIDLGTDVSAEKIVSVVKETGAHLVGLSTLLSTMVGGIKDVVDAVTKAGMKGRVRIVIGGACTSEQLKDEMGADAYGETAIQAVRIFDRLSAAH